jgi:hypothetical protein
MPFNKNKYDEQLASLQANKLKILRLPLFNLQTTHLQELSAALATNSSVEEINLCGNDISDVGLSHILPGLKIPTLKKLDLSFNRLTPSGIKILVDNLLTCESLTDLNIGGADTIAQILIDNLLEQFSRLLSEKIFSDLSDNSQQRESSILTAAGPIIVDIQNNARLETLVNRRNIIGAEGFECLLKLQQKNVNINAVEIDYKNSTDLNLIYVYPSLLAPRAQTDQQSMGELGNHAIEESVASSSQIDSVEIVESTFATGKDCLLFAQIQGDSEIDGTRFEGNSIREVFICMKSMLHSIAKTPLSKYISNAEYDKNRSTVIVDHILHNMLDIENHSYDLKKELNLSVLQKKAACLPYSIDKHAIFVEFIYNKNSLELNIYNTGLGLEHHNTHNTHNINGKTLWRACKSHVINLSIISEEDRPWHIAAILDLAMPDVSHKAKASEKIDTLYAQFENIVMLYPGSTIEDKNSSLIIGQRSGTCVWKSMFRYMREKLKQNGIGEEKALDLLLKYDFKLRSMLDFKHVMENKFDEINVTPELVRVVRFACNNNARLARKMFTNNLITSDKLQAALDLCAEISSKSSLLESKLKSFGEVNTLLSNKNTTKTKPQYYASPIIEEKQLNLIDQIAAKYLISNAQDCISAIDLLHRSITVHGFDNDLEALLGSEHVMQYCQQYLAEIKPNSLEIHQRLLHQIKEIALIYNEILNNKSNNKEGLSEIKVITVITMQVVALQISMELFNQLRLDNNDNNQINFLKLYRIFFANIENILIHRRIIDPALRRRFLIAQQQIDALWQGYAINYNDSVEAQRINEFLLLLRDNPNYGMPYLNVYCDLVVITRLSSLPDRLTFGNKAAFFATPAMGEKRGGWDQGLQNLIMILTFLKKHPELYIKTPILRIKGYGPTPFDFYILQDVTEVYSKGLLCFYDKYQKNNFDESLNVNTSNVAYTPRSNKIILEDAKNNEL